MNVLKNGISAPLLHPQLSSGGTTMNLMSQENGLCCLHVMESAECGEVNDER